MTTTTLAAMKINETRDFGQTCYPVLVTRVGPDAFRIEWCGEVVALKQAARRLTPLGIYG